MSERKYRQRGYQDDGRKEPRQPRDERPKEFRAPSMPGFRSAIKCAQCGSQVTADIQRESRCGRCGMALHSCAQCVSFDSGRRFECAQPIPARVAPKDAANTCSYFEPRRIVERETGSAAPADARSAFDDLFK